jgi:hypothetical protein
MIHYQRESFAEAFRGEAKGIRRDQIGSSIQLHVAFSPSRLDDESGKKCKRKAEKKGEKLLPRKVFSGMLDESRRVGRIARRIPKPPRADDKWKATEMQHKRARTVDE